MTNWLRLGKIAVVSPETEVAGEKEPEPDENELGPEME
jgi:hypothetical protein